MEQLTPPAIYSIVNYTMIHVFEHLRFISHLWTSGRNTLDGERFDLSASDVDGVAAARPVPQIAASATAQRDVF